MNDGRRIGTPAHEKGTYDAYIAFSSLLFPNAAVGSRRRIVIPRGCDFFVLFHRQQPLGAPSLCSHITAQEEKDAGEDGQETRGEHLSHEL
jgi:hypothetical protein